MKSIIHAFALVLFVPFLQAQANEVDGRIQEIAGLDPKQAKAFFLDIKKAVGNSDRSALSKIVAFPSLVNLNSGKNKKIKNASEFLDHFDEIFTPKVIQAVRKQAYEDLFVNYQGVMIGSGEVWFSAKKGPSGKFDQFRITKINN